VFIVILFKWTEVEQFAFHEKANSVLLMSTRHASCLLACLNQCYGHHLFWIYNTVIFMLLQIRSETHEIC